MALNNFTGASHLQRHPYSQPTGPCHDGQARRSSASAPADKIFGRAGLTIARSILAHREDNYCVQLQPLVCALRDKVPTDCVVQADKTPLQMLSSSAKKTLRA